MKKRILSLLLLVAMLVTAVPLAALAVFATEPAPQAAEPTWTEEDYNDLYVQAGLVYAFDAFTLNEHWEGARGTHPAFPVGPSENTAYWYDANKNGAQDEGEVIDLTEDANRYVNTWAVASLPNNYSYKWAEAGTVYATKAEAMLAAYNLANGTSLTELPEGATAPFATPTADSKGYPAYDVVPSALSDAYKAAAKQWNTDEKAWFASYAWQKTSGTLYSQSFYSGTDAKPIYAAPKEHSVFRVEDGYLQFRTDYNAGMNGGLLPLNFPTKATASSVQLISWASTGVTTSTSYTPFILHNIRVAMRRKNGAFELYGLGSSSGFKLETGSTFPTGLSLPLGTPFTYTQVQNVAGAAGEDTLVTFDQSKQLFSLTGTYNNATLDDWNSYIGFSNAQAIRLYALRYYTTELTINEVAQNHFADLAKWFRLDLTPLGLLDSEDMKAVYAAVANFNFDSDRAEVAAAVLSVAQAKAAEKYASLDAAVVAIAVQYGLDVSPLTVQPKGMLKNTYAFLTLGYKTSDDIRADYEAALALDLASTMTAEQYDALYVQEGLKVALDYFASNQYWLGADAPTSAVDPAYLRLWDGSASYLYLDDTGKDKAPMTVKDGYLAVTYKSGTYANLGYTNYVSGNGYDGATAEYVVENVTPMSGQILNLDDIRVSATVSGTAATITAVGQRDSNVGPLARPTATEGELNILKGQTLATFTMAGAMTYALTYKRPVTTQSYYNYDYAAHGDPVKPDAGQSSTSCFYVTHDLVDGVLTKRMKNGKENPTAVTYAFHIPIYYDNPEDGKKYIVGYTLRYSNNGIGNGGDAEIGGSGTKNFYTADTGEVALMINGATMFDYDDVYFPDSDKIFGGTYLRHTYGSDRNVYAFRHYNRQLSAEEFAQNHFVDVAKFFRLNITGFEALDAEGKAALYAAVADIDLASATRTEAQNAVSGVLNAKADAVYDAMKEGVTDPSVLALIDSAKAYRLDIADVLAAKRDMSTVFALSFDGLSCNEAQALLDEAYLDAYFYRSYMLAGQDDFNALLDGLATSELMKGRDRLDTEALMTLPLSARLGVTEVADKILAAGTVATAQVILDDYVNEALAAYPTGYGEKDAYNALYVDRGLLLAADYFNTNKYWGGTMTAPVNPSENTAYWYDANKDGKQDEGEVIDLTKDENRYNGKWSINYMINSWTRQRLDADGNPFKKDSVEHGQVFDSYEAAQLAAYNLANGTTLTELPAGQGSLFATPTAKNGYPAYEVARDDLSDAFKAAAAAWQKADRAELKTAVWFNTSEKDLLYFSYDKATSGVPHVRARGAANTFSAFRVGDGYITIRENLDSDGGLQTDSDLKKFVKDAASTQVIGTLNDKIAHNSSTAGVAMSIFYNVRPMVKKSADGKGMVLQAISNFTASDSLPTTAISFEGVKDMTYTLKGIGTEDPDHFSLRFSDEAWIDVDGTYASWNGTAYLGYGTAFGGAKIYATRYYSVDLTNAEIAQNHFADLAKFFRIDLEGYEVLDDAQRAALYASVADMTFENTTRAAVQEALAAAVSEVYAPTYDAAEGKIDAGFLAVARELGLDISGLMAIREDASRAALVAPISENFRAGYALNVNVVRTMLTESTAFLDALTFKGMSVRIHTGYDAADMPGVRAQFVVNDALLAKGVTAFGVEILNADGNVRAILRFTPAVDENGDLLITGTSTVKAKEEGDEDKVTEAVPAREAENGTHTFAYTVIYASEDVQTVKYYSAEMGYRFFVEKDGVTYTRDIVTSFGELVSAAEVYTFFYENAEQYELVDEEGKIDSVVTAVYETLNPKAE